MKVAIRASLALVLVLLTPSLLFSQNNTTRFFVAYDYENLTVDNTAGGVAFDSTIVGATAQLAVITVSCASGTECPIRFTYDGDTTPTTSVGLRVDFGTQIYLYSITNIKNFLAIREGATSAVLNVQFHR